MFSKKATKIDEIFTVNLTLFSKCQIDCEDFINFCSLLGKYELYNTQLTFSKLPEFLISCCWMDPQFGKLDFMP